MLKRYKPHRYFPENDLLANSFIGAWYMPHDIIDDICVYREKNKHKSVSGKKQFKNFSEEEAVNIKNSEDISISSIDETSPWREYRGCLQEFLKDYFLQYPEADEVARFNICESFNLQWYPKGGGYYKEHFENAGDSFNVHRHLVFMTYCADVPNAGTHFKYQDITTPCEKGLTLIWPATFTHPHKGQITEEHEKLIVTGWYNLSEIYEKLE